MNTTQIYGLEASSMKSPKLIMSDNNLADSFNSKTKKLKAMPIVDLLDTIRPQLMQRTDLRQKNCNKKKSLSSHNYHAEP